MRKSIDIKSIGGKIWIGLTRSLISFILVFLSVNLARATVPLNDCPPRKTINVNANQTVEFNLFNNTNLTKNVDIRVTGALEINGNPVVGTFNSDFDIDATDTVKIVIQAGPSGATLAIDCSNVTSSSSTSQSDANRFVWNSATQTLQDLENLYGINLFVEVSELKKNEKRLKELEKERAELRAYVKGLFVELGLSPAEAETALIILTHPGFAEESVSILGSSGPARMRIDAINNFSSLIDQRADWDPPSREELQNTEDPGERERINTSPGSIFLDRAYGFASVWSIRTDDINRVRREIGNQRNQSSSTSTTSQFSATRTSHQYTFLHSSK